MDIKFWCPSVEKGKEPKGIEKKTWPIRVFDRRISQPMNFPISRIYTHIQSRNWSKIHSLTNNKCYFIFLCRYKLRSKDKEKVRVKGKCLLWQLFLSSIISFSLKIAERFSYLSIWKHVKILLFNGWSNI